MLDAVAHRVSERLQVGQTRIVDLEDDDALLAGFDADTRYGVRRAAREGVETTVVTDAGDRDAIERLHELVRETQRRAGFRLPPVERYWTAWQALAGAGRACLIEARREGAVLAAGMLVVEGEQSFYLFAGSRREERRRDEALRLVRGPMGHDARGPCPRREAPRPVGGGAGQRGTGSPVARGRTLQEGLRRTRGDLGGKLGDRRRSARATGSAPPPPACAAARHGTCHDRAVDGPRRPDRCPCPGAGHRHPGRRGDRAHDPQ